jgi:hypothetical protein
MIRHVPSGKAVAEDPGIGAINLIDFDHDLPQESPEKKGFLNFF